MSALVLVSQRSPLVACTSFGLAYVSHEKGSIGLMYAIICLGAVAAAVAESQDPSVAARPVLEARRNRVEQLRHDGAQRRGRTKR